MLYFSDWTPMLALDDSTLAALFRAAVRYAAEGEVPDFEGVSAILWGMIAPKIDRDGEAFAEKCRKARYSRYRGIEKSHDRAPLEYDEWIDLVDNRPSSTIVNRRDQLQSSPNYSHNRKRRGMKGGAGRSMTCFRHSLRGVMSRWRRMPLRSSGRRSLRSCVPDHERCVPQEEPGAVAGDPAP